MKNQLERSQAKSLMVTDGLTVTIFPNTDHEFLMTTHDVAIGYGVSDDNIRGHKLERKEELVEGKHFISSVRITHAAQNGSAKCTMWTKRGVIRLGFNVRSKQGIVFRDWAEDLIMDKVENKEVLRIAEKAAVILGSSAKLAARIGVNPAVLSHLKNSPHLVSAQMCDKIEMVCRNIVEHGTGLDNEIVELLLGVDDKEVRFGLYKKILAGDIKSLK